MVQRDVDTSGLTFLSEEEKFHHVRGQRERAIAERSPASIVKKEASDQARKEFFRAAMSR